VESLPAIDQWGLRPIDQQLDRWSDLTQNSVGLLAFAAPVLHAGLFATGGAVVTAAHFAPILGEWILLGEATFWNAAINEWVRNVVQRPRPLLLTESGPEKRETLRAEIGNYNSFYSGHTSFAALAATMLVTYWRGRRHHRGVLTRGHAKLVTFACGVTLLGVALAIITGILRVAAGRHYPTDVIAGAVAGTALAWMLRRRALRRLGLRE